jgi:hypothetical protein
LTYTRRNKVPVPPLQPSTLLHLETTVPSTSTEKVVSPLPPLVHEFLLKPTPTKNEILLNIDVASMFGKMNMNVPVPEMCKIVSVRREVLKLLNVLAEKEEPPIILNTTYLDGKKDTKPPFYLYFGMNGLCLNNCMLKSEASSNVMSLKVMEQLGLKVT